MARVAVPAHHIASDPEFRSELLKRYPDAVFNEKNATLAGQELIDFAKGHEKLVTALEVVDAALLDAVPEVRVISKLGVGLNTIDLKAMADRGVRLGWRPGVNRHSVAQLTLAYILICLRRLTEINQDMRSGNTWNRLRARDLAGRTVGIIGCGHIGKELVRLLQPFQCPILVNDIRDYPDFYAEFDIKTRSLEDLLKEAEIVTIHTPLDDTTRGQLTAGRLALMKPDAVLVNAARGEIVDEVALKAALKEGRLAAAAFDVFAVEPATDEELIGLPNFFCSPHIGATTEDGFRAMGKSVIECLDDNHVPTRDWPLENAW